MALVFSWFKSLAKHSRREQLGDDVQTPLLLLMNHSSSGSLVLSKAIQGFISFKSAEGLSDRTVDSKNRLLQ